MRCFFLAAAVWLCVPGTGLDADATEAATDALPPPVALSEDQQHAVDLVLAGRSILFHVSRALPARASRWCSSPDHHLTALRTRGMGHKVAITASTGIASVNIGGITLHSFAGVGLCFGR